MSRYKISYSKTTGLFSGTTWHCDIYDRKFEQEYSGRGNSKKEALDDAWDSVWRSKGTRYSNSSFDTDLQSQENDNIQLPKFITRILFLAIAAAGFFIIRWAILNQISSETKESYNPNFLEAFSMWILIFCVPIGAIMILVSIVVLFEDFK